MTPHVTLTLTGDQHAALKAHLFPGDGNEAAAVVLCGRRAGEHRHRLLVREVHLVPYDICTRAPDRISWPVDWVDGLLDRAAEHGLSVAKFHSHPTAYPRFSRADDYSDGHFFPGIHALIDRPIHHASVVMLETGAMFGRTVGPEGEFEALERVTVVGDDIEIFHAHPPRAEGAAGVGRATAAFGRQMTAEMNRITAAYVGASGTGSIVNEQLGRLGVGRIISVDADHAELKNLNRIVNETAADAAKKIPKVEIAERAVKAMGLGSEFLSLPHNVVSREVIEAVAEADILFGCVDTAEGRDVMNRLCAAFLVPYIDVGVTIRALKDGTIDMIEGVVHYLKPGGSSLLSREAYSPEQVAADALQRQNPALYEERVREKYIRGANEEMPAIISVNMTIAAMGVNEFLARLYKTRNLPNRHYATTRINLAENEMEVVAEGPSCPLMRKLLGVGDAPLLLGLPELSA